MRYPRRNFPKAIDAEYRQRYGHRERDPINKRVGRYLSHYGYVENFRVSTFKRIHTLDLSIPDRKIAIQFGSPTTITRGRDGELQRLGWSVIRFPSSVYFYPSDSVPLIILAYLLVPRGFKREYSMGKITGIPSQQRVDFAHPKDCIVVEYDGTGHAYSVAEDSLRDRLIETCGWTPIRIPFRRYRHHYVQVPNPRPPVAALYRDLDTVLGIRR